MKMNSGSIVVIFTFLNLCAAKPAKDFDQVLATNLKEIKDLTKNEILDLLVRLNDTDHSLMSDSFVPLDILNMTDSGEIKELLDVLEESDHEDGRNSQVQDQDLSVITNVYNYQQKPKHQILVVGDGSTIVDVPISDLVDLLRNDTKTVETINITELLEAIKIVK